MVTRGGDGRDRGQDGQMQPRAMALLSVAEQNRAAMASWSACGCGHTSHARLFMSSAALSSIDAPWMSRTSADVVRGLRNVEDVMADTPDSTAERRNSGTSVPALPWEVANEEGSTTSRYARHRDRRVNRATDGPRAVAVISRSTAPILGCIGPRPLGSGSGRCRVRGSVASADVRVSYGSRTGLAEPRRCPPNLALAPRATRSWLSCGSARWWA